MDGLVVHLPEYVPKLWELRFFLSKLLQNKTKIATVVNGVKFAGGKYEMQ